MAVCTRFVDVNRCARNSCSANLGVPTTVWCPKWAPAPLHHFAEGYGQALFKGGVSGFRLHLQGSERSALRQTPWEWTMAAAGVA